ncbi:MAG: SRPBCC domain-containing protein [Chloroflexi bacterium]|nr:SRPBCC domain-containing protein [Chloroflexota bacterium]
MATIEHQIDIEAPAGATWAVLTDFARYPDWNPFMRAVDGEPSVGRQLTITITPGRRSMTFKPVVLAHERGQVIRWRGRFLLPGVFDGEHELRVEPIGVGRSRFTQRERFTGVLVPILAGMLKDTGRGFEDMNNALKQRVEAGRG